MRGDRLRAWPKTWLLLPAVAAIWILLIAAYKWHERKLTLWHWQGKIGFIGTIIQQEYGRNLRVPSAYSEISSVARSIDLESAPTLFDDYSWLDVSGGDASLAELGIRKVNITWRDRITSKTRSQVVLLYLDHAETNAEIYYVWERDGTPILNPSDWNLAKALATAIIAYWEAEGEPPHKNEDLAGFVYYSDLVTAKAFDRLRWRIRVSGNSGEIRVRETGSDRVFVYQVPAKRWIHFGRIETVAVAGER